MPKQKALPKRTLKNNPIIETFPGASRAWSLDWDKAAIRTAHRRRRRRRHREYWQ